MLYSYCFIQIYNTHYRPLRMLVTGSQLRMPALIE